MFFNLIQYRSFSSMYFVYILFQRQRTHIFCAFHFMKWGGKAKSAEDVRCSHKMVQKISRRWSTYFMYVYVYVCSGTKIHHYILECKLKGVLCAFSYCILVGTIPMILRVNFNVCTKMDNLPLQSPCTVHARWHPTIVIIYKYSYAFEVEVDDFEVSHTYSL